MLSRDDIANMCDFTTITVDVPEWGGSVLLRSMTVGHHDDLQIRLLRFSGAEASPENGAATSLLYRHPELLREVKSRLLSYCLCDARGTLLLNDDAGRAILEQRNPVVIDRLYEAASQLNRLSSADVDEEKKDSEDPPTDDSSSSSASASDGVSPN
jgi:hypothetical protein